MTADHFADTEELLDYGFEFFGAVPSLVSAELRVSREQVMAASVPPATPTATTAPAPAPPGGESPGEPVLTSQPVAIRMGRTPQGLGDLLGWMLRLFSSEEG